MNITIINGIQDVKANPLQVEMEGVVENLKKKHALNLFTIEDMNINYCCGCFDCWVKTPGYCIFKDDMDEVLKSIVKTDYLFIISPLVKGFISSDTKRAMDRIIPTLLPFIRIFDGESHHVPRYENRCNLGVVILGEDNMNEEATMIVNDTFDRFAKNIHALKTVKSKAKANELMEVLINEISNC